MLPELSRISLYKEGICIKHEEVVEVSFEDAMGQDKINRFDKKNPKKSKKRKRPERRENYKKNKAKAQQRRQENKLKKDA